MAELEKTLGRNAAIPTGASVPLALSAQIQAAANLDELAALRMALEGSSRLGLLDEEAISGAYRLIEEGCWKLYSTQSESVAGEKGLELQRSFPLHALQRSINQGTECMLLIDGHNVLFRLRGVLQLEFEENIPGPRARRQL